MTYWPCAGNGVRSAICAGGFQGLHSKSALTGVAEIAMSKTCEGHGPARSVRRIERGCSGMAGTLTTGSLEQSNVDITSELVDLMTSQRNYQANSKVISTESTMLQALMQAV